MLSSAMALDIFARPQPQSRSGIPEDTVISGMCILEDGSIQGLLSYVCSVLEITSVLADSLPWYGLGFENSNRSNLVHPAPSKNMPELVENCCMFDVGMMCCEWVYVSKGRVQIVCKCSTTAERSLHSARALQPSRAK